MKSNNFKNMNSNNFKIVSVCQFKYAPVCTLCVYVCIVGVSLLFLTL